MNGTVVDTELLRRYDKTGPRYTSYPTAVQFTDQFSETDYHQAAIDSNSASEKPLSLYFHIPFCSTLCFYCACSKIVTKNQARGREYLEYLFREIELQGNLYNRRRSVTQLHLGGGTPTFYSIQQIDELLAVTLRNFNLVTDDRRDYSIEIDPRTVDSAKIKSLGALGFTRISLGVQDFDPAVQKAVHRVQSEADTLSILDAARDAGFKSTNVDLIYGLPLQSESSFARTLDTIIDMSPDRLSIFNYAHLPKMFSPQRRIHEIELPSAEEKLDMLRVTVEKLTGAGYVYIGMDHFAKPDDILVTARDEHTLYRNFQGYASHADCDLIGMGITSISKVANCYSQNVKTLDEYYRRISENRLPVARGITLEARDQLRRDVINSLMCYGEVEFSSIEQKHGINFRDSFSRELGELETMQGDGLLEIQAGRVVVLPPGRYLIRNIGMIFDEYLLHGSETTRFSRVI
jgi:oxygen-independent coproporphyrinogen-3 oxidase